MIADSLRVHFSSIPHRRDRLLIPIEIRPDIGAALAAGRADKARLDVGEPDIIGPAVTAHGDKVAAFEVGAIDQQPAQAHVPHLGEGDLGWAVGHTPMVAPSGPEVKPVTVSR